MFPEILNDICRLSHLSIIGEIKRSGGLGITEIARIMDMSYMGVKAHCVKLSKQGYIKGAREPKGSNMGRPRKIFTLTEKCDPLFPSGGDELILSLLDGVKASFGEASPEKLLYHYFETKRDEWKASVKSGKSKADKAAKFVKARKKAGHFCQSKVSKEDGLVIEEFHHPLHKMFARYPGLIAVEIRMIEQALETKIERTEKLGSHGGVLCTLYKVAV